MLGSYVSPDKYNALAAAARESAAPWLLFDRAAFTSSYNRRPFIVAHRLAEHPLFSLGALLKVCRRMPQNQIKYRFGVVPANTDFDRSLDRFHDGLSLQDALDQLEQRQAYIVVNNPERDAVYRPAIEELLGEIALSTGTLDRKISWYSTYVFISAQGSVTPYHMDREMNFLLQIRGAKTVQLWDPFDEQIMTSAQRDLLLTDRSAPRPSYEASFDAKAMVFELQPGMGVHHPFIAPHLVRTGSELSISLAFTFRTENSDVWTDAHNFNHHMRKLGLHPRPVRRSAVVDRAKARLLRAYRRSRALWRGAVKLSESGTI